MEHCLVKHAKQAKGYVIFADYLYLLSTQKRFNEKTGSLVASFLLFSSLTAQETLQTVADRGNTIFSTDYQKYILIGRDASSGNSLSLAWRYNDGSPYSMVESFAGGSPLVLQQAGGNVGIGIIAPTQKLEVNGAVKSYTSSFGSVDYNTSAKGYANFGSNNHGTVLVSSNLFISGNDNLKIVNNHNTMSGAAIMIPGNGQPNQNSIVFYTKSTGTAVVNDDYSIAPRMIIDASGNIGIGTTSPQSELAVKGTITSKKIKVTLSGWADYVFDPSYQLQPLSQIEKYIQENKHLPEVPTTAEVKKDGIDIGDNQALLLKKIEELTLYIIQQSKRLDAQEKVIAELKEKIH
ncbi:hypothetical protein SAMN05421788_101964 [Filimonas lacunae]|uniref:Chaperone of endosialidase n=1 Tax=Filimonas lacunae TaxID=477680 RepID=A0A173MQ75_9BACT|nr:hypothetical protein [Filimonas lacunae]BAV09531.1 hypothetical protein FLA_5580 [Filimonas lacunae]SIS74731.1 hypothetical protein SAMN05421788_101964 [Filimonas lacunae]